MTNNNNNNFSPYSPNIINITIGDGKSAKIGIISDFQLGFNYFKETAKDFEDNLFRALTVLKKNNIELIIIAGDTTNYGKIDNYLSFKKVFYSVYNYNKKPLVLSLMGNHDYFDTKLEIIENQKRYFNYMNCYPYSHYNINNYNFIFWSNDNLNYDDYGITDYSWIKSTLEKAKINKKKEGDPIFVISHIPPKKTVYGSEGMWGVSGIYDVFKNYQEIISISGHSHYSLRNIKSIWQGEFTAINTQSLSYVDLDDFHKNVMDVRINSVKNDSMGLIAYLNEDNILFERIEFSTEEIEEEKWKIDFPINASDFIYTFDKRNKKIKPIFNDNNEIRVLKKSNTNYVIFNVASHEEYVYNYKIVLKRDNTNKEYFYYSDYYKNKKLRKKIMKFELPNDIDNGKYDIEIYAIDSFNNISQPKIGVINI